MPSEEAESTARERVRQAFAGPVVPRQTSTAKPIAFNAAMMRALLAGQKTQTRRPIRPLPVGVTTLDHRPWPADAAGRPITCRLATAGSTLWVREPWAFAPDGSARLYEADLGPAAAATRSWKGGRFLPRDASRMLLDVKEVRPERLDELTDDDAGGRHAARAVRSSADDLVPPALGRHLRRRRVRLVQQPVGVGYLLFSQKRLKRQPPA